MANHTSYLASQPSAFSSLDQPLHRDQSEPLQRHIWSHCFPAQNCPVFVPHHRDESKPLVKRYAGIPTTCVHPRFAALSVSLPASCFRSQGHLRALVPPKHHALSLCLHHIHLVSSSSLSYFYPGAWDVQWTYRYKTEGDLLFGVVWSWRSCWMVRHLICMD